MTWGVEVEFPDQLHVELTLANQLPRQLAVDKAAFERRALRVHGVRDRRKCLGHVARFFRGKTFSGFARRPDHAIGLDPGGDLPEPRLDTVGERNRSPRTKEGSKDGGSEGDAGNFHGRVALAAASGSAGRPLREPDAL